MKPRLLVSVVMACTAHGLPSVRLTYKASLLLLANQHLLTGVAASKPFLFALLPNFATEPRLPSKPPGDKVGPPWCLPALALASVTRPGHSPLTRLTNTRAMIPSKPC